MGTHVFWLQVRTMTLANLKARYRKTWAGFLWVVLNPLMMFGVQSLVFRQFLNLQVPNYAFFLLSGLLPWIFINSTLEMSTSLFVTQGRFLKSFPIDPRVPLAAQVLDNLINFVSAFLLVLVPLWITHWGQPGLSPVWSLAILPIPLLFLAAGTFGLAWWLATAHVFFRDTRFIVSFAMGIGFYLTPIFYPESYVPARYHWIIHLNPLYVLIAPFRVVFYDFSGPVFLDALLRSAAVTAIIVGAAALFWARKRNAVYFSI